MKLKTVVPLGVIFTVAVVVGSSLFFASQLFAATTIGTDISTSGSLTVSGNAFLSGNQDLNLATSENIVLDWGSTPDAASYRSTVSAYSPVQTHRLNNTSPFVAEWYDITANNSGGPALFYNTITRNANSIADSMDLYTMKLTNNGDSGDRVRMFEILYDADSTQPGNFMTTSYLMMLDMDENVNNFGFPNGLIIEAGTGGDDAGVDGLLRTGINVGDADIDFAIDIGTNKFKVGSDGVFNVTMASDATGTTTITTDNTNNSNQHLRLDPGGTGKFMVDFTQEDLVTGSCLQGQFSIDTGGASKEFCFCASTNTWYCAAMGTTTGPID